MVRGNGGWKQTLLEICITTPRGGQRRWMGKRGQGVLSVEKAGAHTSIRETTPRPELLRHLSELLPPVHHLALAPLSTFPCPLPPFCHLLVPPSLSRATFCMPAMPPVPSVYVVVDVKTASFLKVRCTSNERGSSYLVARVQIKRINRVFRHEGNSNCTCKC